MSNVTTKKRANAQVTKVKKVLSIDEFLNSLTYSDPETQGSASVGTFEEIYSDLFKARLQRFSKNKREDGSYKNSSVMLTNIETGKITWLTCSRTLTEFVRSGVITLEHIMLLPVFRGDNGGNYVGLPAQDSVEVSEIEAKELPNLLSPEDAL